MMKRKLFTLGTAILLSASSFAQRGNSCNTHSDVGNKFSIIDNFVSEDGPLGANYWGYSVEENTSFSFQRNTTTETLDITVNHQDDQSVWVPMGLDINFSEIGEKATYLDATNGTISISITNPGDQDIEIYFSAISNGTSREDAEIATASNDDENITLWGGVITAGNTVEWDFDLSTATKRTWQASKEACEASGGTLIEGTSNCIQDAGFDVRNISSIEFSVNKAASSESSWQNGPLENYDISINYLLIGECASGATTPEITNVNTDALTNTFNLSVVPVKDTKITSVVMKTVNPNQDTRKILITENPNEYDPIEQEVDQIIKGTFEEEKVTFVYDYSDWISGDWTLSFTATDEQNQVVIENV